MTWIRSQPSGTAAAARSWYLTAATAAVVAPALLVAGRASTAITLGGLLAAAAATAAGVEGHRRGRGAAPSVLAVGLLAGCSIAAALACLVGIVIAGVTG